MFDVEPISWPEQAPGRVRALVPEPEPEQEQERALGQVPEPEPEPERVWPASSVQPERAPGPVCWPLAVRRVLDAGRFCRKRNTRQSPG